MSQKPVLIGRTLAANKEFLTRLAELPYRSSIPRKLACNSGMLQKCVHWNHPAFQTMETDLTVDDRARALEYLDQVAMVSRFFNSPMELMWPKLLQAEASWGYDQFLPHVAISRKPDFGLKSALALDDPLQSGPQYRKSAR